MVASKPNTHVPPVACALEKDVPAGTVIPPSVRASWCESCQQRVLVSASSREMIARGVARPMCFPCAERAAGPTPLVAMTPEQLAEMASWGAAKKSEGP